tara:strand:- start:2174 stop:2668 length:495 start_codon:yes stop_codon:yes gene_type:complete
MAILFKNFKAKFFEIIPLILLFIISLNGASVLDFKYVSVNVHYILIYYWVLRLPNAIGYGFIFLSGIITDVVLGLPMGATPLTLLTISAVAAYVRVVTVRISLVNDWVSFIPALLLANSIYFIILHFSNYSIDYLYLFQNSIFTLIFYPFLWVIFSMILRMIKN